MCTSLTFESENNQYFLARTMDFGFELSGKPVAIPRNYTWTRQLGGTETVRYGFIGTGRKLADYVFADGVNEKGLAIAELYYPNEASYQPKPIEDKLNLAPHELILWILGEISSIEELRRRISEVALINEEVSLLGLVPPLHFILTDPSGETVVLETNDQLLTIKSNPMGVMTNSPELEWHLKNLNNYLGIQPTNFAAKKYNGQSVSPFGQGSGTFGLPGGYTSPERFVRTTYLRSLTEKGTSTNEAVNNIFQILNNVTIPKGVNIKDDGSVDYTQYRAVFNSSQQTYYFNPYHTQEVFFLQLTDALLTAATPVEFPVPTVFTPTALN